MTKINVLNQVEGAIGGNTTLVGTHDDMFHADEVFGTVILTRIFGELTVLRTRNEAQLANCSVVYDVGLGEFDHHQPERNGIRSNGVPYAAAGLLWRKFGRQIVVATDPMVDTDKVVKLVDRNLIQGIDALDNGFNVGNLIVQVATISHVVFSFNPRWDEDKNLANVRFAEAVSFAAQAFEGILLSAISQVKAERLVKEAIEASGNSPIVILPCDLPWQECLLVEDPDGEKLFVVYEQGGTYLVQGVRVENDKFELRKTLPKAWAGLRDQTLEEITGVQGAVFCHPVCFICGANTLEGALRLAELAVAE